MTGYRKGYRLIECQICHGFKFKVWIETKEQAQANIMLGGFYTCVRCSIEYPEHKVTEDTL